MNKIIYFLTFCLSTFVFGQIGVGTETPSESAMVDLVSTEKGFSGSHISLQSITDKTTIPNPADGLLVYNTNTTSDLQPGYYVWIINKWTPSNPTLNLEVTTNGKYPAWKPDINEFTSKVLKIYKEFNPKASLEAIHAGLECAIFKDIYPHIKVASIGPTIKFPHSRKEQVSIKSVENVYVVVKEILKEIN